MNAHYLIPVALDGVRSYRQHRPLVLVLADFLSHFGPVRLQDLAVQILRETQANVSIYGLK